MLEMTPFSRSASFGKRMYSVSCFGARRHLNRMETSLILFEAFVQFGIKEHYSNIREGHLFSSM
jgi:hypothetical protein